MQIFRRRRLSAPLLSCFVVFPDHHTDHRRRSQLLNHSPTIPSSMHIVAVSAVHVIATLSEWVLRSTELASRLDIARRLNRVGVMGTATAVKLFISIQYLKLDPDMITHFCNSTLRRYLYMTVVSMFLQIFDTRFHFTVQKNGCDFLPRGVVFQRYARLLKFSRICAFASGRKGSG